MSAEFKKQGDYKLIEISITNYQGDKKFIDDYMISLNYTEDMFQPFIFGSLKITDSIDLVQFFPIIGEETLTFSFVTDESIQDVVTKEFSIYKVSNRKEVSDNTKEYDLLFCSKEVLIDQNNTITKSYKGYVPSQIISDICKNYLETNKNIVLDDTINPLHVIIPNWTPLQTINWLSGQSIHKVYKSNGVFFFFENRNGLNFQNIETIINKEPITNLRSVINSIDRNYNSSTDPTFNVKDVITSFNVLSGNDTLGSLSDGMYGARVIGYDSLTKQIKIKDFDYEKEFNNFSHLGKFKINSGEFILNNPRQRVILSASKFLEDSAWFKETNNIDYNRKSEEVSLFKSSYLSQLMSNKTQLSIPGNSDLTVGETVNVSLPNNTSLENYKNSIGDKYIGGKMVIFKCDHSFSLKTYKQNLLVFKDSFDNDHEYLLN